MTATPYRLAIDGFPSEAFRVHELTGKEVLSEAYAFDVVATAGLEEGIEQAALGQRAVLTFHTGEAPRAFYGIVAAVRLAEVHHADASVKYVIRLVPRLWLLRRKKRTRIFQRMRVPDIVTAVLGEAGIAIRWQLSRAYPEREYCTQYEETDYRFILRILAEAGIYFYFFGGPPLADGALGAAAAAASASLGVGEIAGAGAGALVGSAIQMGEVLIPGDTLICADDATCYPPVAGDDPAALAASTAAALAPAASDVLGAGEGRAGAVLGAVSAFAGAAIARVVEGGREVPVLHFLLNEAARVTLDDKITRFTLQNSVRSSAATFRDYDPLRPMVRLQSTAVSTQPFPPTPFEVAAQAAALAENAAAAVQTSPPVPGAAVVAGALGAAGKIVEQVGAASGQRVPFEVYDHHGPFLFPKWAFAADEAPRMLRQKRRRASVARGEGGCSDFSPGHRFELHGHLAAQLDGAYVITRVEHRGAAHPSGESAQRKVYWNAFECVPAEMTYPPRRPDRKSVQVTLTATVVGPPGEEIHVDALGQIKVQFHWDREGRHDDRSSCWIRVMQPWAGTGWGHQFIPRVGMEVVVGFEGGDPDKPIVLGTVYNGTHPPPFRLPGDKTRSGIRTQSSPGGGGFNELSFEDAAGNEQVYLHAQRNLNEVVERNHTLLVKNEEFIRILGNRLDVVERNLEQHVRGDHAHHVRGNRLEVVTGNADEHVSGTLATRVEGRERRNVTGDADLEYTGDVTTRVKGCLTTLVGKHDKKRSWVTHAEGKVKLSSSDATEVSAEGSLMLRVGKSWIRMTSEKIELVSPGISLKGARGGLSAGGDGLALSSKGGAQFLVKEKLVLKTEGASLALDKEVKIDGAKILLNSPEQASDPPPKPSEPPTKVTLKDTRGRPLAYQRFLVVMDDGSEVSDITDKDGNTEMDLESGGKIVFPDVNTKAGG